MAEPAYTFEHQADTAPWPKQGSWTWDDYLRLPEDGQRYEIIHGVLYVSPAPRLLHQFIVSRLVHFLTVYALQSRRGAPLTAPVDVLLPGIASPVQPDVVFLGSENLPDLGAAKNFEGVPDLTVEVLSPGSRRLDLDVKLRAYEQAGVPEYWIIDPEQRTVVLNHLEDARGYRQWGPFRTGEVVRSVVLSGFELKVEDLFP